MGDGIVFTGERLDRVAERRSDPAWLAAQAASPHARAVLAGDAGVHVTGRDEPRLALLPLAPLGAPVGLCPQVRRFGQRLVGARLVAVA